MAEYLQRGVGLRREKGVHRRRATCLRGVVQRGLASGILEGESSIVEYDKAAGHAPCNPTPHTPTTQSPLRTILSVVHHEGQSQGGGPC